MASINEKLIICLCFMLASSTIFVSAGGKHGGGGNGGLAAILAAGLIALLISGENNVDQRIPAATHGYQVIPSDNGLGYIPEALTLGLLSRELSQNYEAVPEILALNQGLNYGNIHHNNALLSSMFAQELGLLPGNIPLKYGPGLGVNELGHSLYGFNGLALNQGVYNHNIVRQALKQQISPVPNAHGFNGLALNQGIYNPNIVPQVLKQQISPVPNAAIPK